MIVVDRNRRIVQVNETAKRVLSIVGDCIGKKLPEVTQYCGLLLAPATPEDRERFSTVAGDGRQRIIQFTSEAINGGQYTLVSFGTLPDWWKMRSDLQGPSSSGQREECRRV